MRGRHQLFKYLKKAGIVVVPGNFSNEVAIGTLKSIWKQAQLEDKK